MNFKRFSSCVLSLLVVIGILLSQLTYAKPLEAKPKKGNVKTEQVVVKQLEHKSVSPNYDFSFESCLFPSFYEAAFFRLIGQSLATEYKLFKVRDSYRAKVFEHLIATKAP
jgi:hypothetical protein